MSGQRSGLVGQSVQRVEDDRLLRGDGTYVADVDPPDCLHAAFLRSPFPHARINGIDVAAARRLAGVHAIYTGVDIVEMTNPFLPVLMQPGLYTPLYYSLATDCVRMVGDPVALVVAQSRYIAEDALELIEVDYTELDGIGTIEKALAPGREPIWPKADGNVLYEESRDYGEVEEVFSAADRIITETFECPRQANQPMETRGVVVEHDPASGQFDVHAATQSSHVLRWQLAAFTAPVGGFTGLRQFLTNNDRRAAFFGAAKTFLDENKEGLQEQDNAGMAAQMKREPATGRYLARAAMNLASKTALPTVRARDIGGGFGSKGAVNREDIAVTAAALALGRSVKWIEDRVENLADGGQAREERMTLSLAVDDDGTIRGLKVDLDVDQGAYPGNPIGVPGIIGMMRVMWPGTYRLEAFQFKARSIATNKGRYIAYRGPWANETWTRERMVNIVARELGLSQAEIRLRNMFGDEHYPAAMITGPTLDTTMSTRKTLERAMELVDLEAFEAQREGAELNRRVGIGFACYHEAAPGPPNYWSSISPGNDALLAEETRTEVTPEGKVLIYSPQMPHGQSHETTYAQIAADQLGVAMDDVTMVYGDTSVTPFSFAGTGGSRGGPVGGGSVRASTRSLRQRIVEEAASLLEASPDDIEIIDGNVHVTGVPARGVTLADIAAAAEPDSLRTTETYLSAGDGGWSCATHVCIVDVDLETGLVRIPRYVVVEDCGPIINPAIVDGQVRGGVAQGVGAVLYERVAYDADANLQSSTYMDYLIPTAMEVPEVEVHHIETLSPGENDFRGVGEGGMLGAPAAITNAIEDALGVTITEQYLPPTRILELAGVIEPDD